MELIPDGLVATVQMRVREGGDGEDGVLKRTKDGEIPAISTLEFILVDTKHAKMKFWQNLPARRRDRRPQADDRAGASRS